MPLNPPELPACTEAIPHGHFRGAGSAYLAVLTWAFTLFSSLRVVSYLPTLWTLQASGDSSQYSLWTWTTWFGANLTMAAWLYEHNGQRLDRAALFNLCNAVMCGAVIALVLALRIGSA